MIGPLSELFWLLLLRVELVDGIEAKVVLSLFALFLILFPVVALSLKLSLALIFDVIKGTRVQFSLTLNVFLYGHQSLFSFDCRLIELFNSISLLLLSDRHIHLIFVKNFLWELFLICFDLFSMLLNWSLVFHVSHETVMIELFIVIFGVLAPLTSLLLELFKVLNSVCALFLQVLLVALRVGFVPALFENQLGSFFHGEIDGFFPGSLHLFDSVLFSLEHFLSLHDLPAWVLHQEGLDCVVRVDWLLGVEEATLLDNAGLRCRGGKLATRRLLNLACGVNWCEMVSAPSSWIIGVDHALGVTGALPVFLVQVDKFGHVLVRLGQMKRLWLASIIPTASLRFK